MDTLLQFLEVLLGFVPEIAAASALIAIIVDTAKRVGLPNGYAPLAAAVLNLVFYGLFWFIGEDGQEEVGAIITSLEVLAPVIVAWLVSMFGANWVHKKAVPAGFGYSHPPKSSPSPARR
jgi:hypothetical protein